MEIIKPVGTEVSLSTANTVSNAKCVRLFNNTAGAVLITRSDNKAAIVGTFTMQANSVITVEKRFDDTLTAASAILAAPVAFTN